MKKEPLQLPEADGVPVTLNEKVYVPIREHPDVSTQKKRIQSQNLECNELRLFFITVSVLWPPVIYEPDRSKLQCRYPNLITKKKHFFFLRELFLLQVIKHE